MLYTLLIVLIAIVAVLLVLVVLAQKSKGGVSAQFGGSSTQMIGVRKTGDILERLTWGFGAALMVLSLITNTGFFVDKTNQQDRLKSVNERKAKEQRQAAPIQQQGAPVEAEQDATTEVLDLTAPADSSK
jgi:preprotein translocase subunit SecG